MLASEYQGRYLQLARFPGPDGECGANQLCAGLKEAVGAGRREKAGSGEERGSGVLHGGRRPAAAPTVCLRRRGAGGASLAATVP